MAAPYAEFSRSRRKTPRSTSCSKSPRAGAVLLNHIVGDITTAETASLEKPPSVLATWNEKFALWFIYLGRSTTVRTSYRGGEDRWWSFYWTAGSPCGAC